MRRPAVLLLALLSTACYESEFPLDPAPLVAVDPGLLGTWRCLPLDGDADELPAVLTIARDSRDKVYDARWEEPGDRPDHYEAYASTVGTVTIFNLHELGGPDAAAKWEFARIALLRPDVLHLQIADDKALAGTEATRPALRAALERLQTSATLFSGGVVCVRARPAQ